MKKKSYISIFFKAIVIYVVTFCIVYLVTPNFNRRRPPIRERLCKSNIKVILGAVEMYNIDSSSKMDVLNIDNLLKGRYLKEVPVPPEDSCNYLSSGELSEDGRIYCQYHKGKGYRSAKEIDEEIKKENEERHWKAIKDDIKNYFLRAIPSIIYLFFALM